MERERKIQAEADTLIQQERANAQAQVSLRTAAISQHMYEFTQQQKQESQKGMIESQRMLAETLQQGQQQMFHSVPMLVDKLERMGSRKSSARSVVRASVDELQFGGISPIQPKHGSPPPTLDNPERR